MFTEQLIPSIVLGEQVLLSFYTQKVGQLESHVLDYSRNKLVEVSVDLKGNDQWSLTVPYQWSHPGVYYGIDGHGPWSWTKFANGIIHDIFAFTQKLTVSQ